MENPESSSAKRPFFTRSRITHPDITDPRSTLLIDPAEMLIKLETLRKIRAGQVRLAFRRWKKPTVKSGGKLHTVVGQLEIRSVTKTSLKAITAKDAKQAGFETRASLLEELRGRAGETYRIDLCYAGEDPRVDLANDISATPDELRSLVFKLRRMDGRSKSGPWTLPTLALIDEHSEVSAAQLAERIGIQKMEFKANVRKLKNLGLTVSLAVGYQLSPRGAVVLKHLKANPNSP